MTTTTTPLLDVERIITTPKRDEVRAAVERVEDLVEQVRPTIEQAMGLMTEIEAVERQFIRDAEASDGDADAASTLAMSLTGSCDLGEALARLSELADVDGVLMAHQRAEATSTAD